MRCYMDIWIIAFMIIGITWFLTSRAQKRKNKYIKELGPELSKSRIDGISQNIYLWDFEYRTEWIINNNIITIKTKKGQNSESIPFSNILKVQLSESSPFSEISFSMHGNYSTYKGGGIFDTETGIVKQRPLIFVSSDLHVARAIHDRILNSISNESSSI